MADPDAQFNRAGVGFLGEGRKPLSCCADKMFPGTATCGPLRARLDPGLLLSVGLSQAERGGTIGKP